MKNVIIMGKERLDEREWTRRITVSRRTLDLPYENREEEAETKSNNMKMHEENFLFCAAGKFAD